MQQWMAAAAQGRLPQVVSARDHTVIFERDDRATQTYLLQRGAVEILQRSALGFSVVVKILRAPTLFGQIEPLGREKEYLETVRVLGNATFCPIPTATFTALLSTDPRLALECLSDVCRSFCLVARFEPSRMFDTDALLANLLLAYADVVGIQGPQGVRLALRRTQSDFAQAIGASERSVNRILLHWKATGILDKARARYTLCDLAFLRKRCVGLEGSLVDRPPTPPLLPRCLRIVPHL